MTASGRIPCISIPFDTFHTHTHTHTSCSIILLFTSRPLFTHVTFASKSIHLVRTLEFHLVRDLVFQQA
ncbi:hypothetical protein PDJAM_G00181760, partial [Pangasius djambal]|nr:hypothetical protein [Pangasius djambal]